MEVNIKDIKISVIVIAYLRTTYIKEAITSLLNQDYDKDKYEIIVVKNFIDLNIDNYLLGNGINIINSTRTSIGGKIVEGIESARGEIICLLEDDDLFKPEKLKVIDNIFSQHEELCYYHNQADFVDQNSRLLNHSGLGQKKNKKSKSDLLIRDSYKDKFVFKAFRLNGSWNNSCISIRKSFFKNYYEMWEKVKTFIDGIICFTAFIANGDIVISGKKLTYYRKYSDSLTGNLKHDDNSHDEVAKSNIDDNLLISHIASSIKGTKSMVFTRILVERVSWQITEIVYSHKKNRKDALEYLFF